jgi:hypothetical protein
MFQEDRQVVKEEVARALADFEKKLEGFGKSLAEFERKLTELPTSSEAPKRKSSYKSFGDE